MTGDEIRIRSSDGLSLEAAVDEPAEPRGVVAMCHPHPRMGGTMNAPLVLALRDRLVVDGWSVVRFNFRGIGGSEGRTGTGTAELADARGAVSFARERYPTLPLAIAGWSFGGAIAVRVAADDGSLVACVAIAPAVVPRPGVTDGIPEGVVTRMPTLVVCGANDDQVSPAACARWAAEAGARYEELKGANHFFWGRYEKLTDLVAAFLHRGSSGSNDGGM